MTSSRIPGFYRLDLQARRKRILKEIECTDAGLEEAWDSGGLTADRADQIVENVLGVYSLPFGVALNARINDEDRLIPMVVEEPSVIAAASNACKMIRAGGGFAAKVPESLMISQIELRRVKDTTAASSLISSNKERLLSIAGEALQGLIKRGGGPRDIEVRTIAPDHLVVHLLVACCDAMGANLVNTAAEHLGPELAKLCEAELGLCILSNLSDRRMVEVTGTVPLSDELTHEVALGVEQASIFAERDPYRAATHNKGIMNGVDSVVIATGNDYRAVEAGAHAFAAASGRYSPLARWRVKSEGLSGSLTMPLAVGTVGGTIRVHAGARAALAIAQVKGASDLACLAACAGLASNLAALRALSTEGIQKGHMALHARAVATAAGAVGDEVQQVARTITETKSITMATAEEALRKLRKASP